MARDIVHMRSLERIPVGRLGTALLAQHAGKRADVDRLDGQVRVLRERRHRQDQRRHPRQKREPRGALRHIALPSPITRRHALIWPRCIIWWLLHRKSTAWPNTGKRSLNTPSTGFGPASTASSSSVSSSATFW